MRFGNNEGEVTNAGGLSPRRLRRPTCVCEVCHAAGAETCALVSAIGASATSMFFYARTKGELERDIQQIGFRSLTICRPSIIAGPRDEVRPAERVTLVLSRLLAPVLPKKFHVNPAPVISIIHRDLSSADGPNAASLLNSALAARPGSQWIFDEQMN